ncbi:MAG: isoprenylcysteine carboxylmethyltransferase family protein [Ignavibacteriales bacterium CG_4_9_14_3_um_filter_34_10]|nr:MAG: isoprenylcysteine carboxylmethyltransferase family protein [Ignavibacteriales bacterium CG_4_9_14_3_um_filter_34_10]
MIRMFMWILMLFGGAAFGLYLDNILFDNIHTNILFHVISFLIGVILFSLVIRISKNTGRTLAKYGRNGNVKRMETNVLVRQGAYKYMRHPMHLGLLFFPLSIAFLIGSPSFILIIAPVEMILMLILIKYFEEREAIKKFGEEYLDYKKQLPWFCLKLTCLKELLKEVPPKL